MRMAVVNASTNLVVNVVEAEASWVPDTGFITIASETANIGDMYDGSVIVPAPPPPYSMDTVTLSEAISEVCPIVSVTIVDGTNRATWAFVPTASATSQQVTDGNSVIATVPLAPPKALTPSDFTARFTNAEYLALEKKRRDDIAANNVGISKNWDIVVNDSIVKIGKKKVQTLKSDLVAKGVLTQARADEIFS